MLIYSVWVSFVSGISGIFQEKGKYQQPVRDSLRSVLAWGWSLEQDQTRLTANRESMKRRMSKDMVGPGF